MDSKYFHAALVAVLFPMLGSAQNQLAFDETLYIRMSGTVVPDPMNEDQLVMDTVINVPAGHTLKIEDVRHSHYSTAWGYTPISHNWSVWVTLDDVIISESLRIDGGFYDPKRNCDQPPIWLPAGTYTFKLYSQNPAGFNAPSDVKAFISAIQFAIVP
jgi:hypothetical protein